MDIVEILRQKYPNTLWVVTGNDYEGLEWLNDSPKPTEKELADAWPEVQQAREVEAVRLARHTAYAAPDGPDAIFLQYQRGDATEKQWLDAVKAVKKAHPYPKGA
jgi:ABC-type nitrate/sulfonate/bicarbonate transport system substrate-binding protein